MPQMPSCSPETPVGQEGVEPTVKAGTGESWMHPALGVQLGAAEYNPDAWVLSSCGVGGKELGAQTPGF